MPCLRGLLCVKEESRSAVLFRFRNKTRLSEQSFIPVLRTITKPMLSASMLRNDVLNVAVFPGSSVRGTNFDPLAGHSDDIRMLADAARKVAKEDDPVLIEGEIGTGKRDLAYWLYQNSARSTGQFLELNSRLPRKQLEDALFGQDAALPPQPVPSASTFNKPGTSGVVFLRFVQKLSPETQVRLIATFADRVPDPPPNHRDHSKFRLIAASDEKLFRLVEQQQFHRELYGRLARTLLRVPPLRERLADLPVLASQVLGSLAREFGFRDFDLTRSALQVLQSYSWPGNIRELRGVLERAVLVAKRAVLSATDLQLHPPMRPQGPLLRGTLKDLQRQYIQQVLQDAGGRVEVAAKILGVPRSSLYHKIKQYRIERFGLRSAS